MTIYLRWSTKIVKPQLVIWRGKNKKAANRKGLAAQDRIVSYFFYGLYKYMAEELLNWLSLWPPNFVSSLFVLHFLYFLQYGFQSFDEVIHIFLGQYQWREDTKDVGAGTTGEAMLLVDELAANFLVRNIEYGSNH